MLCPMISFMILKVLLNYNSKMDQEFRHNFFKLYVSYTFNLIIIAQSDQYEVQQGLVILAIEKNLLDFNYTFYEKVLQDLERKYNACLVDCFSHPEYLREIVADIYGKSYYNIMERITSMLSEFSYHRPIERFIISINPRFVKNAE